MENTQVGKQIEKKRLFNPNGIDNIENRKIIGGETTNLFNLNDVKYNYAKELYRIMMGNFWVPEKVDLSDDIDSYRNLTVDERRAYDGILSFLVFLDSIQTNNISNIADWITAPEVSTVLAIQTYQEAIHSQSYAYMIESIIPKDRRENIYDFWRDDQVLLERNEYIASIYQEFVDNENKENFARVLIANYILEGLYFYNGFNFFYNLVSRNMMLGTGDIIRYINRDELTHVVLFRDVIKSVIDENPELISEKLVHSMFSEAVEQEVIWAKHILGDKILGISEDSSEKYTKYLANMRLKMLGFSELYPGYNKNPYTHLEKHADETQDNIKSNFFESTVTNYNQSSNIDGWDEL